ncbi:hypothetical protein Tco_1384448 [Tanacetum coccineum]
MKRDVATFVSKCLVCQQVKIEHQRASGLLQPLEIPVWKWDQKLWISLQGLTRTQRKHDAIWVVVDRLTKTAHFLPIRKDFSISRLAEMFQQEIVRLHGSSQYGFPSRRDRRAVGTWHASIKCVPLRCYTVGLTVLLSVEDQIGEVFLRPRVE